METIKPVQKNAEDVVIFGVQPKKK